MAVVIDGVLHVDNSTLTTWAQCPTKAMIRYGFDLRLAHENNAPARAGTAIHAGIEAYFKTQSVALAKQAFDEDYYDYGTNVAGMDQRLCYENVKMVLSSWLEAHDIHKLPYVVDPSLIEIPFNIPIDDGVNYVGRIDAVVRKRTGEPGYYVVDNKSTGWIDQKWRSQFEIGSQMSGYVWAAEKYLGLPVVGVYINAIHVGTVPYGTSRCRTHGVLMPECKLLHLKHEIIGPISRHRLEIDEWEKDAIMLAREWRRGLNEVGIPYTNIGLMPQTGKFVYQACGLCDFREFCKSGRRPSQLSNPEAFVRDPWVPGDLVAPI